MSLQTKLTSVVQAIGADIKSLTNISGSLASLTTTSKASLVSAINELQAALASAGGNIILDSAIAGDTAHTWSADKIITQLTQFKADIISGAPAAYDTLLEISTKLGTDDTALANLLTAVGTRIAFDQTQTLTAPQQLQACTNLGLGDPANDYLAEYTAAKA